MGKLDKFRAAQRSCREMYDIATTLRGKLGEGKAADIRFDSSDCTNGDPYATCGCIRVRDLDDEEHPVIDTPPNCQALNCYTTDSKVEESLKQLQISDAGCRTASMFGGGGADATAGSLVVVASSVTAARLLSTLAQRSVRAKATLMPMKRLAYADFLSRNHVGDSV